MRYAASKLLSAIPVLILVSFGAVALTDLMPGSAAEVILGEFARQDDIRAVEEELGLNDPIWTRYFRWVGSALRGDAGDSLRTNQPVIDVIVERLPITLEIGLSAITLAIVISVPLAAFSAARAGGLFDRIVTAMVSMSMALPTYVIALFLIYFVAVRGGWLPPNGWAPIGDGLRENLRFVALPILALTIAEIPIFVRVLRADIGATLQEEFILAARTRGLSRRYLLFRHALRPSLFSMVTVSGVVFGRLLGGTVIVEQIFSLPGVGSLTASSVFSKDIGVLQAIVVGVAIAYIIVNSLIDASYALLDPRVRNK